MGGIDPGKHHRATLKITSTCPRLTAGRDFLQALWWCLTLSWFSNKLYLSLQSNQKFFVSSLVFGYISPRKHPFLLTLRRWGRFARRNFCDSATEISSWWRKSVWNPVRSAGWSTEKLHCFSYCLRLTVLTDKRQKATEVKCKCEESLTKQSIFVEYSLL